MALSIDELPVDIVDRRTKLAAILGKHRDLREQFAEAALAVDESALSDIRPRLVRADEEIEKAYVALRDAVLRFGSNVAAAIRFMLEEPPAQQEN